MYCAGDYCFRCLGFVGWITLVALGFARCFVLGLVTWLLGCTYCRILRYVFCWM